MTAEPTVVEDLLHELRVDEKLRLVRGGVDPEGNATGYVPPIDRLGIPACAFSDGPLGIRAGEATAFPASIALAATWDSTLAERFGSALADEARAKGFEGVLAPGLNIIRVPQCGRNFEYYSEDPHLAARMATATVSGIESRDVLSTPKHYLANNQEASRMSVSAEVGERALREIYLPATVAAIEEGDAGIVMAAYNRVNGTHMTEHRRLLTDLLKDELGFGGLVMSDWWAVHDGAAAAKAGLDLEMPGVALSDLLTEDGRPVRPRELARRWPIWLPSSLHDAVDAVLGASTEGPEFAEMLRSPFARSLPGALDRGGLSTARLDDMVRRLLGQYERIGLLDSRGQPADEREIQGHRSLAQEIAVRGTVLLKNANDTLPLSDTDVDRIAVLGPNADTAKTGGTGSSRVTPAQTVSPLQGVRRHVGDAIDVEFERGCSPIEKPPSFDVPFFGRGGQTHPRIESAVRVADRSDVAVVVVQDDAGEGADRETLSLPGAQDRLVTAVAETGTPTVVVLATSGPVEMPWLDGVDTLVQTWYPGQEAGGALAAVLFGDRAPGGRLPVTFGAAAGEYPANTRRQYPGIKGQEGYPKTEYDEGIFVGYRHFDRADIEPLFPFGHGHSYTEFAYHDLAVETGSGDVPSVTLRVTVENVGDRDGREVVQAYVGTDAGRLPRPPRELAGFVPIALDAGATQTVEIPLSERAFAVYDTAIEDWVVDADSFVVAVGRSSRDLRLCESVEFENA